MALKEQSESFDDFGRLLFQYHTAILKLKNAKSIRYLQVTFGGGEGGGWVELNNLHPSRCFRIQTWVKGDRVFNVGAEGTGHIQNRNSDRLDWGLAGRIQLAWDRQIRTANVRIDEERQIDRVYVLLEVLAVDVNQIVISLFRQLEFIADTKIKKHMFFLSILQLNCASIRISGSISLN